MFGVQGLGWFKTCVLWGLAFRVRHPTDSEAVQHISITITLEAEWLAWLITECWRARLNDSRSSEVQLDNFLRF